MLQNPYVTPLKKEQKMNLKIYITLIAATAVSAGSACIKAATPAGFDEIVAEVIAGNPALGAERARMAAELGAEAADTAAADCGYERAPAYLLTGEDVGQMDLDNRQIYRRDGVGDGE